VRLLVNFSPTVAIARLVNSLIGVSSRRLRHRGSHEQKRHSLVTVCEAMSAKADGMRC
jgi:REP element-mobilizing transposase RayT